MKVVKSYNEFGYKNIIISQNEVRSWKQFWWKKKTSKML